MATVPFLQRPTTEHIRKQIRNIDESYSHPWDILAELAQNAVDAIREHQREYGQRPDHAIAITIDRNSRTLEFRDTGVGIRPDDLPELLAPHGTNKDLPDNIGIIGQKGVGLTYAIFKCERFSIETQSAEGYISAHIVGGAQWKNRLSDAIPVLEIDRTDQTRVDSARTYTSITLHGVEAPDEQAEDIFAMARPVIEALLRTKTAIGSTRQVFSLPSDGFEVSLLVIDAGGGRSAGKIQGTYLLPERLIEKRRVIDLGDYEKDAAHFSDQQKVRLLQGKCVRKVGAETRAGRVIRYYAFFAPSRGLWKEINVKNEFRTEEAAEGGDLLYQGGIFLATRGMPTGIELTHPVTGLAGNWPQLFILLEDDHLSFDVGRKTVPGRTQGVLKDVARALFTEMTRLAQYLSTDPPVPGVLVQETREMFFDELEALPDLAYHGIPYAKHPWSQEAAVAAIFHQLLGAGVLKGYVTLACGYKMTYDWWGYYIASRETVGAHRVKQLPRDSAKLKLVIEFKYNAEAILGDLENNKHFSDIGMIVCWDLDETKFAKDHVQVRPIAPEDSFYFGANYELEWPGAHNLGDAGKKQVIALRRLIDDLARMK